MGGKDVIVARGVAGLLPNRGRESGGVRRASVCCAPVPPANTKPSESALRFLEGAWNGRSLDLRGAYNSPPPLVFWVSDCRPDNSLLPPTLSPLPPRFK